MKETKQSKMNEDDPPQDEVGTGDTSRGLDGKAPKSKTRQAKNRNETKETKVGRGIEPATGREERTVGDRKRQKN